MIDKDAHDAKILARALATELFNLSRTSSPDNIVPVKSFDLKVLARKAHSIAEILKP